MKTSFTETPWLFLLLVAFTLTLQQVRSDAGPDEYDVNKRQISVLARDGNLPYQGKRYMNERQQDKVEDYLSRDWISRTDNVNNGEPIMFLNPDKRYVGALAKSGDLRFARQLQDKRDEVDTLIDELLTTEELKRLRLEAVRDELLRERLEAAEDEADVEKKSLASLARSGNMPFRGESKKSVSSLARAGLLRPPSLRDHDLDEYGKRGIASLARNGQLPSFGKRGGISSIMRNRMPLQKRSVGDENDTDDEDEIDNLINEIYESDGGKRNIASLARTSNLPYYGKRNMASFVRSGGLSGLNVASKKSMFDDWVDSSEDKRSIPAFFRNVPSPAEGKRYLGAFVASNRLPYSKQLSPNDLENKRNIGAMARNWNLPNSYRFGKRDDGENDVNDVDEFGTSKRYVAALLRQGPIPVGVDTNLHMEPRNFNVHIDNGDAEYDDNRGAMRNNDHEDKRHIGSIAAQKNYSAMRKKKSVTAEDQITSSENKTSGFSHTNHRDKRQAVVDFAAQSDEYPMPVLQNAEATDYDETASRVNSDQPSTRNKRYFGSLARNGWLPEGHYFKGAVSKRHIGALARLGWLPSYRSARAYSRFGRDVRSPCKRNSPISGEGRWQDSGWPFAADREVPLSQPQLWSSPPLDDDDDDDDDPSDSNSNNVDRQTVDADYVKRFLLIPAIDNILLRRQYPHWAH